LSLKEAAGYQEGQRMTAHEHMERAGAKPRMIPRRDSGPVQPVAVAVADAASRVDGTAAPRGISPAAVLSLQRTMGNRAVSRLLGTEEHVHDGSCGHGPSVQRSSVDEVLSSPGTPLAAPLRAEMEKRLGADFSDVRLHSGAAAQRSAAEIGARAYTSGSHVVIGEGGTDRHTLAHELTHVIQQRSGPVAGTDNGSGLRISDPSDRFERQAEANATRVLAGPVPAGPEPVTDHEPEASASVQSAPARVQRAAGTVQRFARQRARMGQELRDMQVTRNGMFAIEDGRRSVWVSEDATGISPALRRTRRASADLFDNGVRYREYQLARDILDDCLHLAEEIMHDAVGELADGVESHSVVETARGREPFGQSDPNNRQLARRYVGAPNRAANPRVGQAYVTVAMNPGNTTMSQYHAAAVVGRDGDDTVTLETFAGSGRHTPEAGVYTVDTVRSFHDYWSGPDSYYQRNYPHVTMRTIAIRRSSGGLAYRQTPRRRNPNVRREA
jgi:hypothetical protein